MNIYYPAYLLLRKACHEHFRALKSLTVYKANEWEDEFGEKIQSGLVFEAIAFLERKKLMTVVSFRGCSTCSITAEGKQAFKKFEGTEEYKAYLRNSRIQTRHKRSMQQFFEHKSREQDLETQMMALSKVCSAFFCAL